VGYLIGDPSVVVLGAEVVEVGAGHLLGIVGFADVSGFGQGVRAEIAAGFGPFVVLFGEDGPDEADDALAVGEDSDDVGAAADLAVEAFGGVVGLDLPPDLFREHGEAEHLVSGGLEYCADNDAIGAAVMNLEVRASIGPIPS
jgi:hypothetical protein